MSEHMEWLNQCFGKFFHLSCHSSFVLSMELKLGLYY
jgi:hypothetical protein